jgi:chorismate mutase
MNDELKLLRKQIDALDDELLEVLAKRIAIVRKIGVLKKTHDIEPLAEQRWRDVLKDKITKAPQLYLSENFITKLYNLIHEYAIEIQKK